MANLSPSAHELSGQGILAEHRLHFSAQGSVRLGSLSVGTKTGPLQLKYTQLEPAIDIRGV